MLALQPLRDNYIHVMNNVIKDLEPNTFRQLLEELSVDHQSNKAIEKYIRNKLGILHAGGKRTRKYWIYRGWSEEQAYVKAKEHNKQKTVSVYSREFWLSKINPTTNTYYSIEEADFERNSRRPIRKEYWIKKGYNEEEAIQIAISKKIQNNSKGARSLDPAIRRITSKRCIEYYTARGHSIEEATQLVSKNQKHFSKDICIEKYGEVEGLKIWQNRQEQWQASLKNKPAEEIARINRLKLTKGITVSTAEKKIIEEINKFDPTLIVNHQLTLIRENKKQYIYDIAVDKKIIEYNGDFWHCNPKKYSYDYVNPRTKIKAIDKWQSDQEKINFAHEQGYQVMVVWEHDHDFKKNKEKVLKKCIEFLTQ